MPHLQIIMTFTAQGATIELPQIGGGGGFGPFFAIGADKVQVIKDISTLISNLLAFITIIAGLWFGFQIITGAFSWMTSGGDKANLESARNRLLHAFTGLVIVVATWAIIGVVGTFLGLDILLTQPDKIIEQISPPEP